MLVYIIPNCKDVAAATGHDLLSPYTVFSKMLPLFLVKSNIAIKTHKKKSITAGISAPEESKNFNFVISIARSTFSFKRCR